MEEKELEQLIPQPAVIDIAGERFEVLPLRVRQLPTFLRAIEPLQGRIAIGSELDILALIRAHGEEVARAVAIAIDRPPEFVGELSLADMVRLAETVIGVNADFFVQQVLPEFSAALARLTAKVGPRSSSGSSSTDTRAATS